MLTVLVFAMGLGWLKDGISWLDGKGGFTQGIVLTLVLAIWSVVSTSAVWLIRRAAKRKDAKRQERLDIQADFLTGQADLGVVDHGVISTTSLTEIKNLVVDSLPAIQHIYENVFGETIRKVLANEDPAYRQKLLKQIAQDIHPFVRTLEGVAEQIEPQTMAFIAAYRVLLKKVDLSDQERKYLADTKTVFAVDFAPLMQRHGERLVLYRKQLAAVEGKQQDLTRMVNRSRNALNQIDEAIGTVATFCAGEMAITIDSVLNR